MKTALLLSILPVCLFFNISLIAQNKVSPLSSKKKLNPQASSLNKKAQSSAGVNQNADTNNDGKISPEERKQFILKLKSEVEKKLNH